MRLLDRLIRRDAGYWEGMASGAAVMTTSYGSPDREAVLPQFTSWAQKAHASSSPVFAAFLIRMSLFSEARLCFQALDDKHLFGNTDLALLEHPWGPESTSRDLLARMEQDTGLTGNAYIWAPPGEDRLVRLRPDWTTIVSEMVRVDGGAYRRKTGYWMEPPKGVTNQGQGQFYPADEVCHWAPIPDPCADFRGMSWLTPVVRDIAGDDGLTQYKIKYLQNSASPNLLIKYASKLQDGTVDKIRERMAARHGGVDNAFKTLVLDQGADVTVIGNSLAQMDFSNVATAGTDRILAASMVPGVLVGMEPLRGAGKGYQESMHKLADLWARPQWRSVCGALSVLAPSPAGNRLWFDASDIAALQDGAMERGQTALVRSQALLTCRQAGYTRESAVTFVDSGDVTQLKPDPGAVPPGGQPVQHMLPQAQPGATAKALPAGTQARLPLGSVSPGDGGNGTRPTPQLAAGRRSEGLNGSGSPFDPAGDISRVGPHGYIHGWIFVGVPVTGDLVHHPVHGPGIVTHAAGGRVGVQFEKGHHGDFAVREHSEPGHFERLNEAELVSEMDRGPGQRFNHALAELERRDHAERENHVRGLYQQHPTGAKARDRLYGQLVDAGENPEDAWSHAYGRDTEDMRRKAAAAQLREQGYHGASFDALSRDAFRHETQQRALAAESATNGFMLNAQGRSAGIDPWSLLTGPESRARKYASEELLSHWDQAGRPTVADFQQQLLGHRAGAGPKGGDFLK